MTTTNKAIFLDRDGVLVKDPGYVHKIEDFELYPDVIESLNQLKDYKLFIVTNQSGIGRGFYTEEDFKKFQNHLIMTLKIHNINILETYFCPHHPEKKCQCRKPSNINVLKAKEKYNLDLENSWVIGDHPHDAEMGIKSGCKAIYMLTGHGKKHFDDLEKKNIKPTFIANNMKEAVSFITQSTNINFLKNNEKNNKIINEKFTKNTNIKKIDNLKKINKNIENLHINDKLINLNTQNIVNIAPEIKKLRTLQEIQELSIKLKQQNKKIVTTNGSFDILHKGHEYFLEQAKKQGDILIVGLNSDNSIKQNKGKDRPINNQETRLKNLAKNNNIDYIVIFNETTPINFLEHIKPNIHANGKEYGENCIEAETIKKYGGKLHLIKRIGDYSTSKIISTQPYNQQSTKS